jgi:hypothetical protein
VVKLALVGAVLAAWVLIPHPLEGPVVMTLSHDHGIHLGDLAGLAFAGLIAWRWLR